MSAQETPLLTPEDPRTRYVRFHRLNESGFVEFAFGVGSPELMADLVMPLAAYREFCRVNRVVYLTREQEQAQDIDAAKWRYGAPGLTE
jgi:phenol hydroxylase P0 protein